MTYGILERSPFGSTSIHRTFPTFAEAVAHARDTYKMVAFEEDADHPGCADFLTTGGVVLSIEPVKD
jgi:hypothetical protein